VSSSPVHPSTLGPVALANIQVDVTTRLGATSKPTPTGFKGLDTLLSGGLRHGTVLALTGAPGSGRTALSLMIAYMAARVSAGVVFVSRGVDETEIVARLAARALRRSYPSSEVNYSDIMHGTVLGNDAVKRAVNDALEAVVAKVGAHLYLAKLGPGSTLSELTERSSQLWARYERVVFVVDDVEGLAVTETGDLAARVLGAAYGLRSLADQGAAVVFTALERHADLVSQAATTWVELRPGPSPSARTIPLELVVRKNRGGAAGTLKLTALYGATEFTED
jgi:replicative DNA helicase